MTNSQLSAEIMEEIELKAEHEAALQFHPVYSPDQNTACRICYRNGAKEYAIKLHQLLNATTEGDKERKVVNDQLREAKKLLDEVFRKHEAGLLPDRFIYEKIKLFLYGE